MRLSVIVVVLVCYLSHHAIVKFSFPQYLLDGELYVLFSAFFLPLCLPLLKQTSNDAPERQPSLTVQSWKIARLID